MERGWREGGERTFLTYTIYQVLEISHLLDHFIKTFQLAQRVWETVEDVL